MESEQQLVHDVKKGNRGAMRRLYNRYSGYAMAVALRYVPDRDDAADVVQDSFVKRGHAEAMDCAHRGE